MDKRVLGKTGRKVSILTLGGYGVGFMAQKEADKAISMALEHGINMIDVAPTYGKAEKRLAETIQKHRKKIFVAEKTQERTKEGVKKELIESMERLGTNYFDLYQFHAVGTKEELDKIMSPGGAMEAFQEAKETGLIKYIGLTGHADIQVHLEALERFEFDVLLLPVSLGAVIHPNPVNDFRPLLEKAKELDIGITSIKAIEKGRWKGKKKYNTWYEPLEKQEDIDNAVWFTLSQKGVTTYSMAGDVRLWPKIISAAERYRKFDEEEIEEMVEEGRKKGIKPLFPE